MSFSSSACKTQSSTSQGSLYQHSLLALIYESLSLPECGHSRPATIIQQYHGTSLLIPFYIALGRATVPVRINVIISLGWLVFLEDFFFLEVCLFLASFPSCPGNSHQIEITGNRRSSLFITKEKGELWTQTQIDSWYPQGGSITLSEVEALNPSLPPSHPHYKISARFQTNHCIHIFPSLGFTKCTQLPQSAFRLLK